MSLTDKQLETTSREMKSNFKKSGLTLEEIAQDLKTTPEYVEDLLNLNPKRIEDPWILRNYLIRVLNEKSIAITPFTVLAVESEKVWFLDSDYINNGEIL